MINWGAGFFSGMMLGFCLVILAVECYFIIIDKATEREFSWFQLTVLVILALVALVLIITRIAVFSILLLPGGYLLLKFFEVRQENLKEAKTTLKKMQSLQKVVNQEPENATAYAALGDLYFRQKDYTRALACYQKAYHLDPVPWLAQKVKVAYRENEISQGNLWLCPECGSRNKGEANYCHCCGQPRQLVFTVKSELLRQLEQNKMSLFGFFLLVVTLAILCKFIRGFALYSAFVFYLVVVYLIGRWILTR
ncbi:MAG: tetratricopeptide repeat protein [Candidatus Omnitrophica bacterium]|nr:tetratricopeptide repeat protein [Candidatus Omnitrophota bacterium]